MLIDFFEFYSTFEFEKYRLCLLTGDMISRGEGKRRLERERLYVVNPIQPGKIISSLKSTSNTVVHKFYGKNRRSKKIVVAKISAKVIHSIKVMQFIY